MSYEGAATVKAKGKISVPAKILEKLGLRVGDRLLFWVNGSEELIVRVRRRGLRICKTASHRGSGRSNRGGSECSPQPRTQKKNAISLPLFDETAARSSASAQLPPEGSP
jgi:AbrB family looped-hinge helix DNA binding protein